MQADDVISWLAAYALLDMLMEPLVDSKFPGPACAEYAKIDWPQGLGPPLWKRRNIAGENLALFGEVVVEVPDCI